MEGLTAPNDSVAKQIEFSPEELKGKIPPAFTLCPHWWALLQLLPLRKEIWQPPLIVWRNIIQSSGRQLEYCRHVSLKAHLIFPALYVGVIKGVMSVYELCSTCILRQSQLQQNTPKADNTIMPLYKFRCAVLLHPLRLRKRDDWRGSVIKICNSPSGVEEE